MPADLAAVQADDALLDMIADGYSAGDADDELTRLLSAWRHEVHAEPLKELVDTSTALALIRAAARRPARRRNPVFGSIAGAAAVVVIAFSSVGLVAKSAEPGDPLWGVTQVLYSEYAQSVETAAAVRTELNQANTALQQGRPQQAREALQRIQQQLPAVGEKEGHAELTTRHRELEQQLGEPVTMPGAVMPPMPAGAEANKSDRPGGPPSPKRPPTTPPDSRDELPTRPSTTSRSDQYWPDPRDPRSYYPYPGDASRGQAERDARDFRPPMDGRPKEMKRPGDTTDGPQTEGQVPGETEPGSDGRDEDPVPSPAPRPRPDPGTTGGTGSSTGQIGAPQRSSSDVPSMSGPNPTHADNAAPAQPPFSASTASV
jgi:Anti-sigma-D factor RsdA to sigma factor binding region